MHKDQQYLSYNVFKKTIKANVLQLQLYYFVSIRRVIKRSELENGKGDFHVYLEATILPQIFL